jgi:hypothetical protein
MLEAAIQKGFVDCDGLRLFPAQNPECGLPERPSKVKKVTRNTADAVW